jgi:hypothetical protein
VVVDVAADGFDQTAFEYLYGSQFAQPAPN